VIKLTRTKIEPIFGHPAMISSIKTAVNYDLDNAEQHSTTRRSMQWKEKKYFFYIYKTV